MPTYEYRCEANGRVVEVNHKIAERVKTWGELCKRAGIAPGRTEAKAPVTKLMSVGFVNTGGGSDLACDMPNCGSTGCNGGMCDLQ